MWKDVQFNENEMSKVVSEYKKSVSTVNVIPDYYLYFNNFDKKNTLQLLKNIKKIGANELTIHNQVILKNISLIKLKNQVNSIASTSKYVELRIHSEKDESISISWNKLISEPSIYISSKKVKYLTPTERKKKEDTLIQERIKFFKTIISILGLKIDFIKCLNTFNNDEKKVNAFLLEKFNSFNVSFLDDALGTDCIVISPTKKNKFNQLSNLFFEMVRKTKLEDSIVIIIRTELSKIKNIITSKGSLTDGSNGDGRYTLLPNIPNTSKIDKDILNVLDNINLKENQVFGFNSPFTIREIHGSNGKIELTYHKRRWHLMFDLNYDYEKDMEQFIYNKLGYKLIIPPK